MANSERLNFNKYYRLGDVPTRAEFERFGLKYDGKYRLSWNPVYKKPNTRFLAAQAIGEYRAPKAGEWYLSGSSIRAYCVPNDLPENCCYYIARLVLIERKTVVTEKEIDVSRQ